MDKTDRIERRLKLHDVRVLMTVAQAGSMSKAAERLGTAQPALSRSIAELEHALGVRLLDRSPRGVEPTQYGHAIIRRGVAVFDELRQGVKDIEFLADPTAGELRIGCSEVIAAGPVLAVINRLTRRYPRIVFNIPTTGTAPEFYRGLMERTIDIAITRVIGPLDEEVLRVETLFEDALVVAAGARNPWTRRRKIKLAELMDEHWVLPTPDSFTMMLAAEAFHASGLELPHAAVVTASLNLRNRLLTIGNFLTIIHGFAGKSTTLKPLLVLPGTQRPFAIITLKKRLLSPLAEYFIANMRSIAKPFAKSK